MKHQVQYIDSYDMASYDKAIASLYRDNADLKSLSMSDKVARISGIFLGRTYLLGAAGEGPEGDFDQAPLYRFDAFDCVTYLNTVLALALSRDAISFNKNLVRIAYRSATVSYGSRHHFISVDWNPHNQSQGLIREFTPDIVDAGGRSLAQYAETLIDRPSWFRHRSFQDIRLLHKTSPEHEVELLNALHSIAYTVESEHSHLPYLPISEMFDADANPKKEIFDQIPQGAIIELIRPNWDLKDKIGTNLNVSHVGFAIRKDGQLYYRQASSIEKCVMDILLEDYLKNRMESPTIKGINIQALVV